VGNVISLSEKRDEYDYRTLQDLALVELFRRDRGYLRHSGLEFKRWIDSVLPTLRYRLPIDPADVFDGERLADLMDAVK